MVGIIFSRILRKVIDKCDSIEYNEIELAMQVGGIPNFWLSFWRYGGKKIKVQQIKFMGDDLRQRRKGNGNKEGKDRKEKQ